MKEVLKKILQPKETRKGKGLTPEEVQFIRDRYKIRKNGRITSETREILKEILK